MFAGAGAGTVKLRLTAQGRRLLRHAKRVIIMATATFTPPNSISVGVKTKLVLRRAIP
jgi:hypothetical protein